jgi:hypothetical protein
MIMSRKYGPRLVALFAILMAQAAAQSPANPSIFRSEL